MAAQAVLVGFVRAKVALIEFVESGGLRGLTGGELVGFAQDFEQSENQSALVHHAIVGEADRSSLAAGLGQRNVQSVLVQALR
ncbi:MAG TPA: hypothetical protein VF642_12120, partial [Propionibacteriaceae bacterium]